MIRSNAFKSYANRGMDLENDINITNIGKLLTFYNHYPKIDIYDI